MRLIGKMMMVVSATVIISGCGAAGGDAVNGVSHKEGSAFFRGDAVAQAVLGGDTVRLDDMVPADSFVWKFMSGLRQIGYVAGNQPRPTSESIQQNMLHKFQRRNNLPQSDSITATELGVLDALLGERERLDAEMLRFSPVTGLVIAGLGAEPSPKHAEALIAKVFGSLPQTLVNPGINTIANFFVWQGSGAGMSIVGGKICLSRYFMSLGVGCTGDAAGRPDFAENDIELAYNIVHEYAHYLDGWIYDSSAQISRGIVARTEEFAAISYDIGNSCNPVADANGYARWHYRRLKNPGNERNEFVTNYAVGWFANNDRNCRSAAEDFAESFAMYVLQGRTFRELTKTKPVLAKKYDWLKKNVFGEREYSTGNAGNVAAINQMLDSFPAYDNWLNLPAFTDYLTIAPDFVWDYEIR